MKIHFSGNPGGTREPERELANPSVMLTYYEIRDGKSEAAKRYLDMVEGRRQERKDK